MDKGQFHPAPPGTILQQDGTYAIIPHLPGGLITDPDLLLRIADVAKKYQVTALRLTAGQRIALVGFNKEDVATAWTELNIAPGAVTGNCVRKVKFCPGTSFCKRGVQDAIALGTDLDRHYHGMDLPSKFNISVSGCPRKCMDTLINDFGLLGTPKGWAVYVGGSGGINPCFAHLLAKNCDHPSILALLEQTIAWYKDHAKNTERIGETIARLGLDSLKAKLRVNKN